MVWAYGGGRYEIDFLDEAACMRYLDCVERLRDAEEAARDGGRPLIDGFCARLAAFFDDVFGDGTGAALLGDAGDAGEALRCYADFVACAKAEAACVYEEIREAAALYDAGRVAR